MSTAGRWGAEGGAGGGVSTVTLVPILHTAILCEVLFCTSFPAKKDVELKYVNMQIKM